MVNSRDPQGLHELHPYFKAVIEADSAPVVICNLDHVIIYLNGAAISRYAKWGGESLLGRSIMDCHNAESRGWIAKIVDWFKLSEENNRVYEGAGSSEDKDLYLVALRDDAGRLIGYYEKHEFRAHETGRKFDF